MGGVVPAFWILDSFSLNATYSNLPPAFAKPTKPVSCASPFQQERSMAGVCFLECEWFDCENYDYGIVL